MICSSKPFQLTRTNIFSTYAAQKHLTSELLSFSENNACPMSANFDKKVSLINSHFLHLNALNMLFSQKDSKSTHCLAHFSKTEPAKFKPFHDSMLAKPSQSEVSMLYGFGVESTCGRCGRNQKLGTINLEVSTSIVAKILDNDLKKC